MTRLLEDEVSSALREDLGFDVGGRGIDGDVGKAANGSERRSE